MAIRSNPYDAAFEAYLIATGRPFVAIDEARRAQLADVSLKSMDFIVDGGEHRLLLDIKGRRFPTGGNTGTRWEQVFGNRFRAAFVFAYEILDPCWYPWHPQRWEFAGRTYAFYAVWVRDYAGVMRQRSPRWETVALPTQEYTRLRRPWEDFLPA